MLIIPTNKEPHNLAQITYNSNVVVNISLDQFDLVTIHHCSWLCPGKPRYPGWAKQQHCSPVWIKELRNLCECACAGVSVAGCACMGAGVRWGGRMWMEWMFPNIAKSRWSKLKTIVFEREKNIFVWLHLCEV